MDKLKQLLTVPEINVNAADHAGWTPLHEAANHGHTLCVKELLKFQPKSEGVVITGDLLKSRVYVDKIKTLMMLVLNFCWKGNPS